MKKTTPPVIRRLATGMGWANRLCGTGIIVHPYSGIMVTFVTAAPSRGSVRGATHLYTRTITAMDVRT